MRKLNTLPSNLEIDRAIWQLCTKPQSLSFGRQLYQLQLDDQYYWLKIQAKGCQLVVEQNYLNELNFYQNRADQIGCILPVHYVDLSAQDQFKDTYTSLILPHAMPWLSAASDLTLSEIKDKILSLFDGIAELAQLGLIHADLKQEHLVNWQGKLKLLDFEQLQHIGINKPHLSATPRYMAPELFHGEGKSLQTELYAVGIIIYEWLSGQRLTANNYLDWAYLHCQHLDIELPARYAGFLALLHGLTAKLKSARFADIQAVKQVIQQINC